MAIPDISGLSHAEIEELLDAVEARKLVLDAEATTNAEAIRRGISGDVDALVALIGPPAATATAGTDSINALLAMKKAEINADPAAYAKHTLRMLRKVTKVLVAVVRVESGRLESTGTGAE